MRNRIFCDWSQKRPAGLGRAFCMLDFKRGSLPATAIWIIIRICRWCAGDSRLVVPPRLSCSRVSRIRVDVSLRRIVVITRAVRRRPIMRGDISAVRTKMTAHIDLSCGGAGNKRDHAASGDRYSLHITLLVSFKIIRLNVGKHPNT